MIHHFVINNKIKKIVNHSMKSTEWHGAYGMTKPTEPNLFLVKDEGVYIMSAGKGQLADPNNPKRSLVAYAEGVSEDDYIGGDDYCIDIPATWFQKAVNENKDVLLKVTETQVSIKYFKGSLIKEKLAKN